MLITGYSGQHHPSYQQLEHKTILKTNKTVQCIHHKNISYRESKCWSIRNWWNGRQNVRTWNKFYTANFSKFCWPVWRIPCLTAANCLNSATFYFL